MIFHGACLPSPDAIDFIIESLCILSMAIKSWRICASQSVVCNTPNNYSSLTVKMTRNILILLLLFAFLFGEHANAAEVPDKAYFASEEADTSVHEVADWIVNSNDNKEMPFIIVDKKQGQIYVFKKEGLIIASAPVLVGESIGDFSAPGVGNKKLSDIKPHERTTPAGRFLARRGLNSDGSEVIWIDFETAIAIHTVSGDSPRKRKIQRLQSLSSKEKRSTLGCINVTNEFYLSIISPLFAQRNGLVYILPETMPANKFFNLESTQTGS